MAQNERREEGNGRKEQARGEARGEQRRGEEPRGGGGLARSEGTGLGRGGGYGFGGAGPFSFARRMLEDMDRLFGELGMGGMVAPRSGGGMQPSFERGFGVWAPQLEVFEEGDSLVVRADLPGLERDDVEVELEGDVLLISGERREEQRDEREGFFRTERSYGRFERAIRVPEGTDPASCEASFENGVLEVRLKTPEQPQRGRRIPIQARGETVSEKPAGSSKKTEES